MKIPSATLLSGLPLLALTLLALRLQCPAQHPVTTTTVSHWSPTTNVVVPHWHRVILPPPRPMPHPPAAPVVLDRIDASVNIHERLAVTTLTFTLRNPGARPQESVVLAPVPAAAVFRSFAIDGPGGGELMAELLPRDEARRIYDDIVRRMIDPGLLEFAGTGLVRSSVFPVPPGGSTRARLVYEELLPEENGRIDYVLPRTEGQIQYVPWSVNLEWSLDSSAPALHCPSHGAGARISGNHAAVKIDGQMQAGPMRVVAMRTAPERPSMALTLYPPVDGEDGYFLLLLAPPASENPPKLQRDLTLVLDRSGSMAGEKLDQVKAAALQIAEGLGDGEGINIITYNEGVQPLFPAPRVKDAAATTVVREFIRGIKASGGTNIHDALAEAMRAPTTTGRLPLVLFLTDGIPTVGETMEKRIREHTRAANADGRRIFTFGVGADVNTPLLSRLADDSRAHATYVLPGEDVEMKVLSVFNRLSGPIVAAPVLSALSADGATLAVANTLPDVLPATLPDLFAGDSRVITGRWRTTKSITLEIHGRGAAGAVKTTATLDPAKASTMHAHVPRLWATRRIAVLTEAIRDLAVDGTPLSPSDPRAKELVDEIVKLSLRHGILSEYTAFLSRDGSSFDERHASAFDHTLHNLQARAAAPSARSGAGAVNQEANSAKAKSAVAIDKGNRYLNAELKEEQLGGVKQLGDRTMFKDQGRWVDSRAAEAARMGKEPRRIAIGSPEFTRLVDSLVADNRQSMLAAGGDVVIEDHGTLWLVTSTAP